MTGEYADQLDRADLAVVVSYNKRIRSIGTDIRIAIGENEASDEVSKSRGAGG
jgi:hypothetical protein